jgi:chaperonin cofactor prefoldin
MSARSTTKSVYIGTYWEQAIASRQMTFPNTKTEKALVGDFDRRLSKALRMVDDALAGQAEDLAGQIKALEKQAEEARKALRSIEHDLAEDSEVDMEAWSRADLVYDQIAARVEPLMARADLLEERMGDILGYASELQSRYPALHRPVLLPSEQI